MRSTLLSLLAVFLLSHVPLSAQSQITTGVIEGIVLDPSGAVLPGVDASIVNLETNLTQSRTTDAAGRFAFLQVQPGRYTATFKLMGFGTYVQTLLFQMQPSDISAFVPPLIALAIAAGLAILPPALRAVRTDPAQTIRNET